MAATYTVIRPQTFLETRAARGAGRHKETVSGEADASPEPRIIPKNVIDTLRLNPTIGTNIDFGKNKKGEIESITIKTKLLKAAIKDDDAVVTALREYQLELMDVIPPRPFQLVGYFSSLSIGKPMTGHIYCNAVRNDMPTDVQVDRDNAGQIQSKLIELARYVPATLVGLVIALIVYTGFRAIGPSKDMMENYGNDIRDVSEGGAKADEVLRRRGGLPAQPKPDESHAPDASTSHQDRLKKEKQSSPSPAQPHR